MFKINNKDDYLVTGIIDFFDTCYNDIFPIYDVKEDTAIDYEALVTTINSKNRQIIRFQTFPKQEPQEFNNFVAYNYVGYLIKNK